jgi:hypothetical protein
MKRLTFICLIATALALAAGGSPAYASDDGAGAGGSGEPAVSPTIPCERTMGADNPCPPPPAACNDAWDNDSDGLVDMGDPGCEGTWDNDEYNEAPPPPPPSEPSYVPMGWLDTVSAEGVAYGWTCDPNDFGAALQVHFYVDGAAGWGGTYIGETTANGWREQGVADACGGNPYHGFAWRLPDSVRNGASRTLYAYAINIGPWANNPMLDGSPKWFNLSPPPPRPACSDGLDNDHDGWVDTRDYGCYDGSDGNEADNEIVREGIEWGASQFACSYTAAVNGQWYTQGAKVYCYGGYTAERCKRQEFRYHTTWAGIARVLTYEGHFAVCYRHGNGITRVLSRAGDSTYSRYPYQYKGNADGYPRHFRYSRFVDFQFRYQLDFCPAAFGCLSTKWPYDNIRFHDNNTMEYSGGIG